MNSQLPIFKRLELHSILFLLVLLLVTACGTQLGASTSDKMPLVTGASGAKFAKASTSLITWPAFDGGGQRSGINASETTITTGNVNSLTRLWQQSLPAVVDGSPVELPNVSTASGVKNLLFVTTKSGSLLALDAATGNQVWRQDTQGQNITTSSPAIDPSVQYIYSYGIDGKVHKYAVGSGVETTTGGWPVTMTLMPDVEKGSSSLNISTNYLYVTISGYNGDYGHYDGHIVAVNLSTGATTVFNALCANITHLLDNVPGDKNYCPDIQAGIWARGGVVLDPVTGNVFVTTGNGPYNANNGGFDYGDSILELSPDLTKLIDTYTPSNYVTLQQNDEDGNLSEVVSNFYPNVCSFTRSCEREHHPGSMLLLEYRLSQLLPHFWQIGKQGRRTEDRQGRGYACHSGA